MFYGFNKEFIQSIFRQIRWNVFSFLDFWLQLFMGDMHVSLFFTLFKLGKAISGHPRYFTFTDHVRFNFHFI